MRFFALVSTRACVARVSWLIDSLTNRLIVGESKSHSITVAANSFGTFTDADYVVTGMSYVGTIITSYSGANVVISASYAGMSVGIKFVCYNPSTTSHVMDITYKHVYI